jgi:hypothetical protein
MRLPQSSFQPLSVRTVRFLTIGMAIAAFAMAPVWAGATASQLVCTPPDLRFGVNVVGQTETLLVTVANTGTTSVTVSGITVSNLEFTTSSLGLPLVLLAGQSVNLSVSFTPTVVGWTNGTVTISSNASNPLLVIEVRGTGASSDPVTASPSAVSFGQVAIGTTSTVPVVLTNDRAWKVTLAALQITGSQFSSSGATLPLTLSPGQSVTVNVIFTPQLAGTSGGSVFVSGPGLNLPLTGTGTAPGQLSIAPAPLNFGNVPDGTTETLPIGLSASGGSVTVSSASSSSSQFVLDGASFPFTIPAGQSVSFNVAFTPQKSGMQSGTLTFASNASNSKTTESLTGTGTLTQYSVNLLWNPSSDVSGYNVYRSPAANGKYVKLNSTLDSNTAYTDSTVVSGQTYYYAATAVNSKGQESSLSTPPVQAAVP